MDIMFRAVYGAKNRILIRSVGFHLPANEFSRPQCR